MRLKVSQTNPGHFLNSLVSVAVFVVLSSLFFGTQSDVSAQSVETSGFETLTHQTSDFGTVRSPTWRSDTFSGTNYRKLYAPNTNHNGRLVGSVDASDGGYDTAIGYQAGGIQFTDVTDVNSDFSVEYRWKRNSSSGNGWATIGPKVSVNWGGSGATGNGLAGWHENYICDAAINRTSREVRQWLDDNPLATKLGTGTINGVRYHFYLRLFSTWDQYWAVRDVFVENQIVETPVGAIVQYWHSKGLPGNEYVDGLRFNLETIEQLNVNYEIDVNRLTPGDFKGVGSTEVVEDSLEGLWRVRDNWQNRYLHDTQLWEWSEVWSSPDRTWTSQVWYFEPVDNKPNVYRLMNLWTGYYLSAPSQNEWDIMLSAQNYGWSSQEWTVEAVGSSYRFRNEWSGMYLNTSNEDWSPIRQAELENWSSMEYTLEPFSQ